MLSATCSNVLLSPGNERAISHSLSQKQKIKDALSMSRVKPPVSSYDTAWVAMVPDSDMKPQFPKCLNWLLENQHPDGSWAFDCTHPLLVKDCLTSTLASLLALHKWNAAQRLVHKGLDFVVSNLWAATDQRQYSPLGFDIVFPAMIEYAADLGLNIPSESLSLIDQLLLNRHSYIENSESQGGCNLARVAEGLMGSSYDHHWNEIIKQQRSNGSLFNSPATTAAAYLQLANEKCFHYLNSLVNEFDGQVPTLYPIDIYTHLSMIDMLQKLGIYRHFNDEIRSILDHAHRCWTEGSDEIFSDAKCCAMAFRLLRLNGYHVSSEVLADYDRKEHLLNSLSEYNNDTKSVLELYKASQTAIFQNEPILEGIEKWTAAYLQQELSTGSIQGWCLRTEVDYALKHPYASMERIESKIFIHNYNIDNITLLKTSHEVLGVNARDLLAFSSNDFNFFQAIHQRELEQLERWVTKYDIDKLKFARQRIRYSYFSVASDIIEPHLCDARAAWAINGALTTVVDDFYDFAGTVEELLNLTELVERWDDYSVIGFKSKDVEILFHAIYGTTNEFVAKAKIHQGRCVKTHLVDIWIAMVKSMLMEAEWAKNKTVPTMYEYLSNAYVSFALGPVVQIPLYLSGHPLPDNVIKSQEYNNLFMHVSFLGRLINDQVSVKRESAQGKLNSVSLQVALSRGSMTEEAAQEYVSRMIESHRRELLKMVVEEKKSLIPRSVKDLFWTMSKVLHLTYMTQDAFSSPSKMESTINAVIHEPIITNWNV